MEVELKSEKKDMAEWLRFLESQVSNRNAEISVLRTEIEEKSALVKQLTQTVETDSSRLAEMTEALASAADAIEHLTSRVHELEGQIGAALTEKQTLLDEHKVLKDQAAAAHTREEELRQSQKGRVRMVPVFLGGIIAGALAVNAARMLFSGGEPRLLSTANGTTQSSATVPGMELKAKATVSSQTPSLSLPSPSETAIAGEAWLQNLGNLRKSVFGVDPSVPWDISPQFDLSSPVVVITRSQFRDIVSKGLPSTLPARQFDGVLLHELGSDMFDAAALSQGLKEENIPNGSLCSPGELEAGNSYKRLSIVFSNKASSLDCLNRALTSAWFRQPWEEVTLIAVSEEPRFAASTFAERKFLSYQEWHPDWIVKNTAGEDVEGTPSPTLRSQRLVRIARVLTRVSDVRIQVPTEVRQIRSENGNIVLPERDGNEANVSFGNFAIIPTGLATGPLRATRLSVQTGKPFGKSVMQTIAPNARAVIINGAEQ